MLEMKGHSTAPDHQRRRYRTIRAFCSKEAKAAEHRRNIRIRLHLPPIRPRVCAGWSRRQVASSSARWTGFSFGYAEAAPLAGGSSTTTLSRSDKTAPEMIG